MEERARQLEVLSFDGLGMRHFGCDCWRRSAVRVLGFFGECECFRMSSKVVSEVAVIVIADAAGVAIVM